MLNFLTNVYNDSDSNNVCVSSLFKSALETLVDDRYEDCVSFASNTNTVYTLEELDAALAQLVDIYAVIQAALRFYNDHGGYSSVQLNVIYMQCIQAIATYKPQCLLVQLSNCYEKREAEDAAYIAA